MPVVLDGTPHARRMQVRMKSRMKRKRRANGLALGSRASGLTPQVQRRVLGSGGLQLSGEGQCGLVLSGRVAPGGQTQAAHGPSHFGDKLAPCGAPQVCRVAVVDGPCAT